MKTLNTLRLILMPFAWLYGSVLWLRNKFFDWKILRSVKFDFPVISVGNLSTGGTGKTPHIEYLIRLLQSEYKMAMLSRGYGRKTKGYILSAETTAAEVMGDEPRQIKTAYPDTTVAVCEDRVMGAVNLLGDAPESEVLLLDDAYQHRYIKPGLNILLTDYSRPFYSDFVLPAGNLREMRGGYKRADVIMVSKCPGPLSPNEKEEIKRLIKPLQQQALFFSYNTYGHLYALADKNEVLDTAQLKNRSVYFFGGIANTKTVEDFLQHYTRGFAIHNLRDHVHYTSTLIKDIVTGFNAWPHEDKIFVTTEKDAAKLKGAEGLFSPGKLYILPMQVNMDTDDEGEFAALLKTYIEKERSLLANEDE